MEQISAPEPSDQNLKFGSKLVALAKKSGDRLLYGPKAQRLALSNNVRQLCERQFGEDTVEPGYRGDLNLQSRYARSKEFEYQMIKRRIGDEDTFIVFRKNILDLRGTNILRRQRTIRDVVVTYAFNEEGFLIKSEEKHALTPGRLPDEFTLDDIAENGSIPGHRHTPMYEVEVDKTDIDMATIAINDVLQELRGAYEPIQGPS
jgi:hypothetical protein